MKNSLTEIIVTIFLVCLSLLLLNPFHFWMPNMVVMSLLVCVLIVLLIAAFIGLYFLHAKTIKSDTVQRNIENKQTEMAEQPVTKSIQKIETNSLSQVQAGSYEVYAPEKIAMATADHHVVLFFRAGWCPTCRSVDADIRAHLSAIPSNLTILDVDYDTSSPLKQKYGVTYQHTFVEVNGRGDLIKKWSGSSSLAALVSEVQ